MLSDQKWLPEVRNQPVLLRDFFRHPTLQNTNYWSLPFMGSISYSEVSYYIRDLGRSMLHDSTDTDADDDVSPHSLHQKKGSRFAVTELSL